MIKRKMAILLKIGENEQKYSDRRKKSGFKKKVKLLKKEKLTVFMSLPFSMVVTGGI